MRSTIFCNDNIDLYFLDFLSLSQIKLYSVISKSTFDIFKNSIYYKEYILFKSKSKHLNFDNICNEGYLNLLKAYIKNFHKSDYNKYNVIEAAKNSHLEVVKYLVTLGANISTENNHAVQLASRYGHLEVVKYLVTVGADVNSDKIYAIQTASENGHLEIVKYLVTVGANNKYAVLLASGNGRLEIVKYLVNVSGNIGAYDKYAVQRASEYGHLEIVKCLVNIGAYISVNDNYEIQRGICKWLSRSCQIFSHCRC